MKTFVALAVLIGISWFSVRAFFTTAFIPTHDAEYHIVRLWQFDKNIQDGIFVPIWAPDLNYGYGVPIFAFFYPWPNYIGEIFHLFSFSFIDSVKLVLATSMVISGLCFYLWLRCFFTRVSSFVGAVSFVLAPYHLVVITIRGSVGEAWALAFFPIVLFFITKIVQEKYQKLYIVSLLSISLSLLLLSHNVLGSIFFAFSIVYSIFISFKNKKAWKWLWMGYAISLLLVSFFFIPLIAEKQYVTGLDIVNFRDHFLAVFQLIFPSWGSGFSVPGISDELSFQLGIVHIIALIIGTYIAIKNRDKLVLFLIIVTTIVILLMLEDSVLIWEMMPVLRFIQFPWRLLSVTLVTTSYIVGYVVMNHPRAGIGLLILCLSYIPYTNTVRYQPRDDSYFLKNENWIQGTTTVGNSFNTKWFTLSSKKTDHEIIPANNEAVEINNIIRNSASSIADIQSENEVTLQFERAYFPGWKGYIDGRPVPVTNNGIINIAAPAGKHSILVKFEGTWIRNFSLWISTVTFVGIVYFSVYSIYENRHKNIST